MRGHIHKRTTGRTHGKATVKWYAVVDDGKHPTTGKRRQKWHGGFTTKREAEEVLAKIIAKQDEGTYIPPSKTTLLAFVEELWYPTIEGEVKPSTFDSYQRTLRDYVLPTLGQMRLQQLTAAHLNALYGELRLRGRKKPTVTKKGLSAKTVHNVHLVISKVLSDALDAGIVSRNVAQRAKPPTPGSTSYGEIKAWTAPQLRRFLHEHRGHQWFSAWHLTAFTGMRRGEVMGLRWRDVDLKRARLSIRHTRVSIAYKLVASTTPKSRQARVIDLDKETVAVLQRHRAKNAKEALAQGRSLEGDDLVFTWDDGRSIHPDTFSQSFDRAVGRSSVPKITFHDLRHTHATIAISNGVPVKVVSERLGHSSPEFTMKVYQHVQPGMQAEAAEQIADAIMNATEDFDDLNEPDTTLSIDA